MRVGRSVRDDNKHKTALFAEDLTSLANRAFSFLGICGRFLKAYTVDLRVYAVGLRALAVDLRVYTVGLQTYAVDLRVLAVGLRVY